MNWDQTWNSFRNYYIKIDVNPMVCFDLFDTYPSPPWDLMRSLGEDGQVSKRLKQTIGLTCDALSRAVLLWTVSRAHLNGVLRTPRSAQDSVEMCAGQHKTVCAGQHKKDCARHRFQEKLLFLGSAFRSFKLTLFAQLPWQIINECNAPHFWRLVAIACGISVHPCLPYHFRGLPAKSQKAGAEAEIFLKISKS